MYDVIVYSGTVLPALGPFKKISLSGYSTVFTMKLVEKGPLFELSWNFGKTSINARHDICNPP